MTKGGKPYGPARFKEIAKERFLISKHINTSYSDTQYITPTERSYLLEFITEDLERQKQLYEEAKANAQNKK